MSLLFCNHFNHTVQQIGKLASPTVEARVTSRLTAELMELTSQTVGAVWLIFFFSDDEQDAKGKRLEVG